MIMSAINKSFSDYANIRPAMSFYAIIAINISILIRMLWQRAMADG
ncbi:MAG: hypothetical protein QG588_1306 [Candidatus Poribacteria bacterium]|nr:hypothetical protein [Candidatus Poribacteria bacterium]